MSKKSTPVIDPTNPKQVIVKRKHNPRDDGHGLVEVGLTFRDSVGRKNASGGHFKWLMFWCTNAACNAEVLLAEGALAEGLDRLAQP